MRFSVEVLWSEVLMFLGKDLMDYGTRSGKSLSLGMPMAPQDNLRTPKIQSLGMPRKASPLSSTSIGNLLGAIFLFTTWYVFCLEHLVLFVSLFFSVPQSSLLYTPFERATHELEFVRILYVLHLYLLCLIVLLIVLHLYLLSVIIFCSSTSLRYFRARCWICFKETIWSLMLHLDYFESL